MNNLRNSMNTPQVSGKPKILLIAVFALFGFMVLIIAHYILKSRDNDSIRSVNNTRVNRQSNGSRQNSGSIPIQNIGSQGAAETGIIGKASGRKQVFNLKKNIFSLDDSEAACGIFGANVASIDQLIESHKQGADWCNVGWTKDGIAAFPIQMDTWKKTQENDGARRNECGSFGINVARSDPHLLYGVNCYGVKPSPRGNEKIKHSYMSDKERQKLLKMDEFKKNINDIPIMPFSEKKWSNCGGV
jgi:hypothetical protein